MTAPTSSAPITEIADGVDLLRFLCPPVARAEKAAGYRLISKTSSS